MSDDLFTAPWLRWLVTVAMLTGLCLLGFLVLDPFIVPVVWAAILGFVTWPGYEWLRGKCRGRRTPAALGMTLVVSAAVIAPLAWLAVVVRIELAHMYHATQNMLAGGALPPAVLKLPWIGDQLRDLWRNRETMKRAGGWAAANWLLDAACLWAFLAALGYYIDPVLLFRRGRERG